MAKRKNNLKFLSNSILLEEAGLPRLNTWIIITVFLMVVLFVSWSVVMEIDETVTINGKIMKASGADVELNVALQIPSKEILTVHEGNDANASIVGLAGISPIAGTVGSIDMNPKQNDQGAIYYEAAFLPSQTEELKKIEEYVYDGMDTKIDVVVGKRSLFQYFVGPVISAKEKAFKER